MNAYDNITQHRYARRLHGKAFLTNWYRHSVKLRQIFEFFISINCRVLIKDMCLCVRELIFALSPRVVYVCM
jgi:hypothetical protein